MGGKSKETREAESRLRESERVREVAFQQAEKDRVAAMAKAEETSKLTPEEEMIGKRAGDTLSQLESGDLTNVRGIGRYLKGVADRKETASRMTPTGAASLAGYTANPHLVSMERDRINAEAGQETAATVDELARLTETQAKGDIMAIGARKSGVSSSLVNFLMQGAGMAQSLAGLRGGVTQENQKAYEGERDKPGWFQKFAVPFISAGSNVASAALGGYFGGKKN